MGLEISQIQNANLLVIAKQADLNQDGVIKGREELNVFGEASKKAMKQNLVSSEDFDAVLKTFSLEYPEGNEMLKSLALQADVDSSKNLTEDEITNFIENGKNAIKADQATQEELETATDGLYYKKQKRDKWIRAAKIAGAAIGGAVVAGALGLGLHHMGLETLWKIKPRKFFDSSGYLKNPWFGISLSAIASSTVAGGIAGGVLASKATKKPV